MTQTTPTCLWNDSASIEELTYSIEHGAVGATCNPVIVVGVLKKEMSFWKGRMQELIKELPTATEDEIAWQLVREISIRAAALLKPIFDAQHGKNGRLSIQTDPRLFRDSQAIVKQAMEFSQLAPNMIVKIPVTRAGIPAIEEATYRGVSINATVSFTLPQCIAVAEAVERGLAAAREGRQGNREHGAGVHADGGASGRLAEGRDGKRKYRDRSGISGMGGSGGAEEGVPDISGDEAIASGCFRRHFAITCTGANSSAATW